MVCREEVERLKKRIRCAKGEIPADIVLKNGYVVNVFTGDVRKRDVAICDGIIAGVGNGYRGKEEIDLSGLYLLPGFIDAHLHIESSMLIPSRLSELLIQHGTTCVISDPHEIANVMGKDGISFMIDDAKDCPVDFFFMIPSCVPSTDLETSGARLTSDDISEFLNNPYILGLAEVMNYSGVISGDEDILKKILLFKEKRIDGHCPSLKGYELQAYVTSMIESDHESITTEEAREKLENGIFLMIREGSIAKNMEDLIHLVNEKNSFRCCFVSDDLHPEEIYKRGHMDYILRKAVRLGLDPIEAIRMVTIYPAMHFGLKERGAICAGKIADIVVVDSLKEFNVMRTFKGGKKRSKEKVKRDLKNSVNIKGISKEMIEVNCRKGKIRVIELIPDQIVNRMRILEPTCKNGKIVSDTERDILKVCVIERHRGTGNIGIGFVKGFGLKKGAIASSVSHDSHNIIAVGVDDEDICCAVREIKNMKGGICICIDGKIEAKVQLEVAGLMTQRTASELIKDTENLKKVAKEAGCSVENPFMILSFLALPVIPEVRITDKGIVDVNRFEIVPLFSE